MFSIRKLEHGTESDLGMTRKQPFCEVVYVQTGCAYACIAGEAFEIRKGQLALGDANRRIILKCSHEARAAGFSVRFDRGFVEDVLAGMSEGVHILREMASYCCVIEPDRPTQKHLESLLVRMLHESGGEGLYRMMLCRLLLAEFLIVLTRIPPTTSHRSLSPTVVEHTVYEIADYIAQNYTEEISLSTLADRFCINPSYLARIFKRFTDYTVVEYINKVRVVAASKLLREKDSLIIDVAECTGFGSVTHFNRIFKRVMGVSPKKYRSAHSETLPASRILRQGGVQGMTPAIQQESGIQKGGLSVDRKRESRTKSES